MEEREFKKMLSAQGNLPRDIKEEADVLCDLGWDIPEIEKMIYFRTRRI